MAEPHDVLIDAARRQCDHPAPRRGEELWEEVTDLDDGQIEPLRRDAEIREVRDQVVRLAA